MLSVGSRVRRKNPPAQYVETVLEVFGPDLIVRWDDNAPDSHGHVDLTSGIPANCVLEVTDQC